MMEECMGVKDDMCSMTISCGRETAESFVRLCSELGITVSECLTAFMREAVRTNGANLLDENGFTLPEAAELRRQILDVKKGNAEAHALVE